MDNLIDIYTKLKLRIGCEVIVTYYKYGCKNIETFILDDIFEFRYIVGYNNDYIKIDFFERNMIIESIRVFGSNLLIYNNPYVNDDIFKNGFINKDLLLEIKNKILGDSFLDRVFLKKFMKRDFILEKYIARSSNIKYEDLFFSDKQKEEFELIFNMLVDSLFSYAKDNGLNYELRFICSSTTSLIYEIGDKIIKIGKPRRCNYIPYCEYILQPIINRNFDFDGYPIHIEVTQKAYVLDNTDGCAFYCDEMDFYDGIEELRRCLYDIGIDSKDLHPANIGILLNDNKIHYNNINFDVAKDLVTSIERNNNLRILRKGRFVIIDLDCLKIENMDKYLNYLKFIGYKDISYDSKCLVRK